MADGSILHGYPLFQRFTQQVLVSGCCVLIAGSLGEKRCLPSKWLFWWEKDK